MKKHNQQQNRPRFNRYWATGENTVNLVYTKDISPLFIEFNKSIGMYRINSAEKRGVPIELMGYNPHVKAVLADAVKYTERLKRGG